MTVPQRLLMVLVLLIGGGAVAAAVLMGGGGTGEGPAAVGSPRISPETGAAQPTRGGLEDVGGRTERLSAAGEPTGVLTLHVVDEDGAPIPARVELTGPEGRTVQAGGSQTWSDFPVGDWQLVVEAEGLMGHYSSFNLAEGEERRIPIKLTATLIVQGELISRLGQPIGPMPIWFLRPKQVHPADAGAGRKLHGCTTNSVGRFTIALQRKGNYRISVGRPGKALLTMTDVVDMHSGSSQEVTIVVSGSTRLEVELQSPPAALAAGKANLAVAVLMQPQERDGDKPKRRRLTTSGSGRVGKRKGENGQRIDRGPPRDLRGGAQSEADADPPTGTEDEVEPPDNSGGEEPIIPDFELPQDQDTWVEREHLRFSSDGKASFVGLPADRELRLVLYRRGDRFQSQVLRLLPDRTALVRFAVPERRTPEEMEREPLGEFNAMISQLPVPPDAKQPGFTWK